MATIAVSAHFLSAWRQLSSHAPLGTCPGAYSQPWVRMVWMAAGVFLLQWGFIHARWPEVSVLAQNAP